ncbi:LON peptidase substrate-binding domain-containing protein [Rhodalgimonas zhirmunskyi]|uniref:LON peptidase substrate-binding domain-containing protein n=1 Tax=Rhodalgimonas zhirmunskyi TaxID=2964767 RepID=A0AAJ1U748_9RHOB|nr:LON peptidase substrate-binding domain-containing protein [Rhodoalgimonas zhirmunskyi]MDQ2094199.1 LON peptidase substrate-binding domain-containing protein [Rhodoalgimonas zhirmunskyi]
MSKQIDLPEVIPVFPLPGAVLLPRSRLPLHLFEPRYLAMFDDALKTSGRLIGMIQPNEVPGREGTGLMTIGCVGRITQFSETEDGRYMITLYGLSRFRILGEVEGFTPYRRACVSWDGFERDRGPEDHDPQFDRPSFLATLERFLETKGLNTDWDTLKDADDELLINSLSMLLDFEPEDKQALLEAPSLSTRRETLIMLIEYALHGGKGDNLIQ